ncbi:signal peptidase I [bacterium]|nr:signal peptidase I [bacterium]
MLSVKWGVVRVGAQEGKKVKWERGQEVEVAARVHGKNPLFINGKREGTLLFSSTFLSHLLDWTESLGFAFFFWILLKTWILQTFFVPSGSMIPNLQEGDKLFGTKYDFLFTEPSHGQMVIFSPPPDLKLPQGDLWVKRVIAGPGDRIELIGGGVWVNGLLLDESYTDQETEAVFNAGCSGKSNWDIPAEGEEGSGWFLLGDNRTNSLDSRCWGVLPPDRLRGRPLFIYWPSERAGTVPHRDGGAE